MGLKELPERKNVENLYRAFHFGILVPLAKKHQLSILDILMPSRCGKAVAAEYEAEIYKLMLSLNKNQNISLEELKKIHLAHVQEILNMIINEIRLYLEGTHFFRTGSKDPSKRIIV